VVSNFAQEYAIRKAQENQVQYWNWMGQISFWSMLMTIY
jgi:hypothetical protein